jgi:hypothetical protein
MRTIKIELRIDMDNPDKDELLINSARMAAKHLLTTAMLISGKRPPLISLETGDMFEGNKEVSLADDIEGGPQETV